MNVYCYEKTATWRARCLLVLLMSLFAIGVYAADTYIVHSQEGVNPSTLSDGDLVVLWHNSSNCLVGCQTSGTGGVREVTKSEKAVTAADANAYVFTVGDKFGSELTLKNGAGYSPKIFTTINETTGSYDFSFEWSNEYATSFQTTYSSAGTHLYFEKGGKAIHLARADGKTTWIDADDEICNWTLYKVSKFSVPTLTSPAVGTSLELGTTDIGNALTGTVHVQGENLTSALTLTLEGDGFSADRTTITAAEAMSGVDVKVSFTGSAYKEYDGTLTITSDDGISTTVSLVARVVNSEDQKPTVHGMLTSWTDNAGCQQPGYTGLGKTRQVLAMALIHSTAESIPVINYRLFGHTEYISAIGVYARKRDTDRDYNPRYDRYASFENTFAHLFDYRNPERNCGAQFLGFTYTVPGASVNAALTSNVKLEAGDYVIYLVANIKTADQIGGIDKLPLIAGSADNFTRIGGVINTVTCGDNTYTINNINNYSAEGGGRVIVPNFEMLYAPRYQKFATADEYSKYYRIPAITKTADGTVVALSDARKNHIHDVTNNIDIVSRRSSDNGKTWSDYLVIFQGLAEGTDCKNWKGYGDVAIASFPNGSVMATAINGYGLSGGVNDPASNVVWKVSRDNGKSWSSEYVMNQNLYGNLRGNISPGNICVAQSGYLKGKAVTMLRTSTQLNNGNANAAGANTFRLYCLTYDPDDNEWTPVTVNGKAYLDNSSYVLDEAQFVQVADNDYLLSVRSQKNGFRTFYRLAFTSETTATATLVTQTGMTLTTGTNGDAITYTAKDGTNYIIHTVPKDLVYEKSSSRTSLSAYYTKATTSGNITWTRSLDLFDPFDNTNGGETRTGIGAFDETAQYSSISKQADGTIGVVMEAYPFAVNQMERETSSYNNHGDDWVMGQYYINLRVGDLIPGAEQPDEVKLDAPEITPVSATYNSADAADRPEITISQHNYVKYADLYNETDSKVNTSYEFELYNVQNERIARSDVKMFQTATTTVAWADVLASLVKEGTTDEHFASDPTLNTKGYYLRVSAYCVADNNMDVVSGKNAAIYTFDTPVRKIMVVGLPTSGASNTTLASQGQSVESDTWLTVGTGKQVVLNSPANYPYKFDGFYYTYGNATSNGNVTLKSKLNYDEVSGIKHQITFAAPSEEELPDNYNNDGVQGLIIYAVYTVEAGFSSRVNTQYNNGKNADGSFDSQYSYWATDGDREAADRIVAAKGGDIFDANLTMPTPESQFNTPLGGNGNGLNGALTYPQKLNYGLDAYITLVPDANAAANLNAVVRLKKGDTYLPQYYVVDGYNQPLMGDIVSQERGCVERLYWYDFVDGVIVPKAVGMRSYEVGSGSAPSKARTIEGGAAGAWYKVESDIAFQNICAVGEDFTDEVVAEVYLVDGSISSVWQLADVDNYLSKVSHPIVMDAEISTGVTDVTAAAGKTVASTVYYNVLGVASDHAFEGVNVVVTTYTDGTKSSVKIVK